MRSTTVGGRRNETANKPKLRPALETQYVRDGAFEFNPNRHDYGTKVFLGHEIKGRGECTCGFAQALEEVSSDGNGG